MAESMPLARNHSYLIRLGVGIVLFLALVLVGQGIRLSSEYPSEIIPPTHVKLGFGYPGDKITRQLSIAIPNGHARTVKHIKTNCSCITAVLQHSQEESPNLLHLTLSAQVPATPPVHETHKTYQCQLLFDNGSVARLLIDLDVFAPPILSPSETPVHASFASGTFIAFTELHFSAPIAIDKLRIHSPKTLTIEASVDALHEDRVHLMASGKLPPDENRHEYQAAVEIAEFHSPIYWVIDVERAGSMMLSPRVLVVDPEAAGSVRIDIAGLPSDACPDIAVHPEDSCIAAFKPSGPCIELSQFQEGLSRLTITLSGENQDATATVYLSNAFR